MRFKIRRDDNGRKVKAVVEAVTHTEAANLASNLLHGRQYALRMSSWNGRDGVFAALDDRTGEEKERFFVEAEDGTGRILQAPRYPPSMTNEDAKKLANGETKSKGKTNGHANRKGKRKGARRAGASR
jgi:hypothetical protein